MWVHVEDWPVVSGVVQAPGLGRHDQDTISAANQWCLIGRALDTGDADYTGRRITMGYNDTRDFRAAPLWLSSHTVDLDVILSTWSPFRGELVSNARPERDEISRCRRTNNDRRPFSPGDNGDSGNCGGNFAERLSIVKLKLRAVRASKGSGAILLRSEAVRPSWV